jgi:hypothetical protein
MRRDRRLARAPLDAANGDNHPGSILQTYCKFNTSLPK